jgi:hypothetical protein
MTRYAQFDHTASPPCPVLGWYDTDVFDYPSLPPSYDLLEVTDDTFWANRFANPWGVMGGTFVDITPEPPPPLTELQQSALDALNAGIQLTSLGTGSLDGSYLVDPGTQININGIVAGIGAGNGIPGGGATFNWNDSSRVPHAFSETNFKNFAAAVTNYVYTLNQIIDGVILALPDPNITIA